MRSSVVPQTIASETAQKENWKKNIAGKASFGSPKARRKNPSVPMSFPTPKAKAKPTAQYASDAIERLVRIFATIVPAFLARENPISRNANPACMKNTSAAAIITHSELIATESGRAPFWAASSASACATAGNASSRAPARGRVRLMARKPHRQGAEGLCPPVEDSARHNRRAVEVAARWEKRRAKSLYAWSVGGPTSVSGSQPRKP